MRLLVTGATGFIGWHLCRRLVSCGHEVHGISRRQDSPKDDGMRWWEGDLTNEDVVSNIVKSVRPEIIFHLASRVTGSRDSREIVSTFHANLASSVHIMLSALDAGCRRIVLAGSSEEPIDGTSNAPCSPYAAAKASATNYARMFRSLFDEYVVVPRIFMTYGPRQLDLQKLLPYTIMSLIRGESPRLTTGRRLVDWIYVDDVVEGLLRAAFSDQTRTMTFDLGSGTLVSVHDVVEEVARIVGNGAKPLFGAVPDRPFEPERVADTKFAEEVLRWRPQVSLRKGLEKTIAWYRSASNAGFWVASVVWAFFGPLFDLLSCPEVY